MSGPTIPLPRAIVDVVRLAQVVLVALAPFLPLGVALQATYAVVTALIPLVVVRQATTPVADADMGAVLEHDPHVLPAPKEFP